MKIIYNIFLFIFTLNFFSPQIVFGGPLDLIKAVSRTKVRARTASKPKVAIVGGGIAGLAAERCLRRAGLAPHIFEARKRLGGRLNTHFFNSARTSFVEEGGTFVDPTHVAAIKLIKELNVPLKKREMGKGILSVRFGNREIGTHDLLGSLRDSRKAFAHLSQDKSKQPVPLAQSVQVLDPFSQRFWQVLCQDEKGVDLHAVGGRKVLKEVSKSAQEYQKLLRMRQHFPSFITNLFAYDYTVAGGMTRIIEAAAADIPPENLHLGHVLTDIKKDNTYHLTFKRDKDLFCIEADKVIFALPFSVLRHVRMDVGLPEWQKKAIQTLPYGVNAKFGVPTSWVPRDLLYFINLDDNYLVWPGEKSITFSFGGSRVNELGANVSLQWAQDQLNLLSGSGVEMQGWRCLGVPHFKNWGRDPFSLGSYPTKTLGVDDAMWFPSHMKAMEGMHRFMEPWEGGLFFAGDHGPLNDRIYGHIEGAVRSGQTAAQCLLEQNPLK